MVRTRFATICCAGFVVGMCISPSLAGDRPIRKLTYDEAAPAVALFDGIEDGQLAVRLSPKSAQLSTVTIKNLTDGPLTVVLPKAAIGVHILPQFQQPQGFLNPNGNNFNGGNGQQNQNQFGQSQSVGGQFQQFGNQSGFPNQGNGLNNGQNNNNNNPFQGMNFFSIPPEKTVQLKLKTVCLNYGWPDPLPGMKYELRSVESEISNPALRKLLENDSPRISDKAMQAAAWHLANGLTWNQLARVPALGAGAIIGGPMFNGPTLQSAQNLVEQAEKSAEEAKEEAPPQAGPAAKLTSVRSE